MMTTDAIEALAEEHITRTGRYGDSRINRALVRAYVAGYRCAASDPSEESVLFMVSRVDSPDPARRLGL